MSDNNLDNLRHSCAHLLAAAVMDLYPKTKRTIGPSIENGFYYDFDFGDQKITNEDFPKIEAKMLEILPTWKGFEGREVSKEEALEVYKGNEFKEELIEEFSASGETLTFYKSGNYSDLCRGGHVEHPNTELTHFKLLSVAGAYWRGNEKNKMLTRIYGTCFPSKVELENHLKQLEQAKERDHRKLGRELELFMSSPSVGPGLVLWLPKGTILKDQLEQLGREREELLGYQRVSTPHIAKEELFIKSGHLPYYADDMYPAMKTEGEGTYYLKPMNCPHMHEIYKFKPHSYRDLPMRLAEFGTVYRYEDSGTLMGLMRVRGLTQNDAHIYCTEDQAHDEIVSVMNLHTYYYELLGIKDYHIELCLPDFDKKPDKYFDNPQGWEKAIKILRETAKKNNIEVTETVGTAAFYGPKFDFIIKSAIGREFGASTNQLDFGSGDRFELKYTDSDGTDKIVPYVIHRAPLGSDERFIGFLIEHFGGAFPVWLSPIQLSILTLNEDVLTYAKEIEQKGRELGIRVSIDDSNSTLGAKIREAQEQKIPYMMIVGNKEVESKTVSLRLRTGEEMKDQGVEEVLSRISDKISSRVIEL